MYKIFIIKTVSEYKNKQYQMTMRVLSKYICHYLMKLAMLLCEEYFASEDITELHVFHRNNMYTKLYFSLRKKNNFHLIFQVLLFCFRNISPGYYHIKCMQVHVDQKLIHLMKFHLYAQSLFSKKRDKISFLSLYAWLIICTVYRTCIYFEYM